VTSSAFPFARVDAGLPSPSTRAPAAPCAAQHQGGA
jgi:hypothetical protein